MLQGSSICSAINDRLDVAIAKAISGVVAIRTVVIAVVIAVAVAVVVVAAAAAVGVSSLPASSAAALPPLAALRSCSELRYCLLIYLITMKDQCVLSSSACSVATSHAFPIFKRSLPINTLPFFSALRCARLR